MAYAATRLDFGKHESLAHPGAAVKWFHLFFIFENFYTPSIAVIKVSFLLLYARIFPSRSFRKVLYAVGVVVLLWWTVCQFITIFQCRPIDDFWYRTTNGSCIDSRKYLIGQAVPNIVTDIIIFVLPLPSVWRLELPILQKALVTYCFTCGGLYDPFPSGDILLY